MLVKSMAAWLFIPLSSEQFCRVAFHVPDTHARPCSKQYSLGFWRSNQQDGASCRQVEMVMLMHICHMAHTSQHHQYFRRHNETRLEPKRLVATVASYAGAAAGMQPLSQSLLKQIPTLSTKRRPECLLGGDMAVQFPAAKYNEELGDDSKRNSSSVLCLSMAWGAIRPYSLVVWLSKSTGTICELLHVPA